MEPVDITKLELQDENLTWEIDVHAEASFSSRAEAQNAANASAKSVGYGLVVKRSYQDANKNTRRVIFACDRHEQRRTHNIPRAGSRRQPNAASRRCGCKMKIDIVRRTDDEVSQRGILFTAPAPLHITTLLLRKFPLIQFIVDRN
ncbi:hypothetical protein F441_16752 [Phytophthora nicotianae CJ01A1]|uniref:FAR1 domain-containing protein n=1 Tax=Phytophthora nicotianae CJ01A1 TaxID=1317063 RepID=W2W8P3_PHYNI|nr:hypothetical protein F441_16752 [Phytophthora nicotianae CJ01A1]